MWGPRFAAALMGAEKKRHRMIIKKDLEGQVSRSGLFAGIFIAGRFPRTGVSH